MTGSRAHAREPVNNELAERQIQMSILNNAIDSLILGLEDFESSNPKRLISCTRNLFAGILLLFKHKLASISPEGSDEALIKQKVLPQVNAEGKVIWKGKGKKTVDVLEIKDRFTSLGLKTHWDRVENINKFRNDIEHYHTDMSKDAISKLITDCFIVVRDFITDEIKEDPKSLLGDEAWETLVSVSEVYEKEKKECIKVIDEVAFGSDTLYEAIVNYSCISCGSGLITVDDPSQPKEDITFACKSCGQEYVYEQMVELSLGEYFSDDSSYLIDCPECDKKAYIYHEQRCAACEESAEHSCARCGSDIPAEELDGTGFCGWCAHMMSKDD